MPRVIERRAWFHRVALALAGGAGAALVAAGCGSDHRADCTMKIYFVTGAPRATVVQLQRRLRGDRRVDSVQLVTGAQALKEMKKKFPDLVQRLPYNPLPDVLEVRPKKVGDAADLQQALDPSPRAVDRVKYRGPAC